MLSRANKAVDAGAGSSAEAGRDGELRYFRTHAPPVDNVGSIYRHGITPVPTDVRVRALRAVGLRTAARVAATGETVKHEATSLCGLRRRCAW